MLDRLARMVLAGKGSLRRAQNRRALAGCAPFRPHHSTMGGSGGNTAPSSVQISNRRKTRHRFGQLDISDDTGLRFSC
jgi:hypothetical protein